MNKYKKRSNSNVVLPSYRFAASLFFQTHRMHRLVSAYGMISFHNVDRPYVISCSQSLMGSLLT